MNKRAQFFLVFAVIIGVLMLSIISLTNRADVTNKNAKEFFDIKCENYRNEIFKISEYTIATGNKSGEYGLIYDFTTNFFKEMNKTYNFEMIFLYGDKANVTVANYFNEGIDVNEGYIQSGESKSGFLNSVTIDVLKTYVFGDTGFYFYMKASKGKEVYTCE
ncbi:MAG: hypothetical protein NTX24_02040 [Candidatus Pacearchaeota archaeon]|nr:hypothetical protein [Candidatus Pacearchaeota archaeon]